ncbi:MAG: nucleotidyltransferase domain-containing protein [Candidatus Poribacteria bacterium]|nr:nucleotidyltransferase domain-containing protein [Candidatus Poribacteria bacterium]
MHQPTEPHRTAKNLSPEELAEYSRRLNQHLQNRKVDEALLQRAWQTVYRVAAMLYKDFGATQVAVFGSLAERAWFSKWSDIDLAVWGIPNDKYFRAVAATSDISGLFKIDLVDFENSKELFQEKIQSQLIAIEKGAIYKVDRSALMQRISDERHKIEETIEKIAERLEKIKTAPAEYREEIETTIAKNLVDCYSGIENIFRRIALDIDLRMPDGGRWHKELLTQMAEPQGERQPVISQETFEILEELLQFRHVFNNIYGGELVYKQTERNAKQVGELFNRFSKELDVFTAYLKKEKND